MESVQEAAGAMIFPVHESEPATTKNAGSENAATGERAVLADVKGKALETPMYIGITALFFSVTTVGVDVLPTATAGVNVMLDGLTPMLPGLVGVVPGATNINVP